jgi:hypothetical protein
LQSRSVQWLVDPLVDWLRVGTIGWEEMMWMLLTALVAVLLMLEQMEGWMSLDWLFDCLAQLFAELYFATTRDCYTLSR